MNPLYVICLYFPLTARVCLVGGGQGLLLLFLSLLLLSSGATFAVSPAAAFSLSSYTASPHILSLTHTKFTFYYEVVLATIFLSCL